MKLRNRNSLVRSRRYRSDVFGSSSDEDRGMILNVAAAATSSREKERDGDKYE